eukprot:1773328-Rhodomonas_salina.2
MVNGQRSNVTQLILTCSTIAAISYTISLRARYTNSSTERGKSTDVKCQRSFRACRRVPTRTRWYKHARDQYRKTWYFSEISTAKRATALPEVSTRQVRTTYYRRTIHQVCSVA